MKFKKDKDLRDEILDEEEVVDAEETAEESEETEGDETEGKEGGRPLCPRCGKRTISKNREFCYRCEDELRHTKTPVPAMIFGLLTLALSVFCFVMVCLLAAPSIQAFKGDRLAAEKNWYSAYNAYEEVDTTIDEIKEILGENSKLNYLIQSGLGLKSKMFRSVVHVYDPVRAYNGAQNFFGDKVSQKYLDKDKYYKICTDYYSRYEKTYDALGESLNLMQEIDTTDKESGEQILEMMYAKEGSKDVDPVFLYYFIATVKGSFGYGNDEMLECYEKADEYAKKSGDDYSWLYYNEISDCYIKAGDYDSALPFIRKRMEDDISAYEPAMKMLRYYVINGDMESAEKLVDEYCANNLDKDGDNSDSNYVMLMYLERVKGNNDAALDYLNNAMAKYSSSPEVNRQAALIHLLNKEYDQAFESAFVAEYNAQYIAYYYNDSSSYTDELFSTLYVATYLCDKYGEKDTENAGEIPNILKEMKNSDIDPKVTAIMDGTSTVEDILTKGVCDFI